MDGYSDKILGSLQLNEEGAVLSSSGDLENDEKSATIIMDLLNLTSHLDKTEKPFNKLSITYNNHCYIVCLSNRKIHVVKRAFSDLNGTT